MKLALIALAFCLNVYALDFDPNPPFVTNVHSIELENKNGYDMLYGFDETGRHRLYLVKYPDGLAITLFTHQGIVSDQMLSAEDFATLRRQLEYLPRNKRPNGISSDDAPALPSACPARLEYELLGQVGPTAEPAIKVKAIRQVCREY